MRIWAGACKELRILKILCSSHLTLAATGLLHGVAQLGIGVLLLQLLVDLRDESRPLGHLLSHLTRLLAAALSLTSCHWFYLAC